MILEGNCCAFHIFWNYILVLILSTALSVFSLVPKAVNLKYPSPFAPKPAPGVPTTLATFISLSKKSHDHPDA